MGYRTDTAAAAGPSDWKCAANGCPLPGALSSERGQGAKWFCRFHHATPYAERDAVTFQINQHRDRIDELFNLWRNPRETGRYVARRPDETPHEYVTRCEMAVRDLIFGRAARARAVAEPLTKVVKPDFRKAAATVPDGVLESTEGDSDD